MAFKKIMLLLLTSLVCIQLGSCLIIETSSFDYVDGLLYVSNYTILADSNISFNSSHSTPIISDNSFDLINVSFHNNLTNITTNVSNNTFIDVQNNSNTSSSSPLSFLTNHSNGVIDKVIVDSPITINFTKEVVNESEYDPMYELNNKVKYFVYEDNDSLVISNLTTYSFSIFNYYDETKIINFSSYFYYYSKKYSDIYVDNIQILGRSNISYSFQLPLHSHKEGVKLKFKLKKSELKTYKDFSFKTDFIQTSAGFGILNSSLNFSSEFNSSLNNSFNFTKIIPLNFSNYSKSESGQNYSFDNHSSSSSAKLNLAVGDSFVNSNSSNFSATNLTSNKSIDLKDVKIIPYGLINSVKQIDSIPHNLIMVQNAKNTKEIISFKSILYGSFLLFSIIFLSQLCKK